MRTCGGSSGTPGLGDDVILRFLESDPALATAIGQAYAQFESLQSANPEFLALDEADQVERAQQGFSNFYDVESVNPYVAVSAAGPWVVTLKGAVIYDCGGYGMLGLGHAPPAVLEAMNQPHVMANVMTASVSQMDFVNCLAKEIGHTRGGSPFSRFLCLNSGSEANSAASRIADINTKLMTDPGGRYAGARVHAVRPERGYAGL